MYPYMTVEQIIGFARPFFPRWRDDLERRFLQIFDLPLRRKIPDLLKGMRSKLMLLLAMSHSAELLVLDEPTDGLDPAAIGLTASCMSGRKGGRFPYSPAGTSTRLWNRPGPFPAVRSNGFLSV